MTAAPIHTGNPGFGQPAADSAREAGPALQSVNVLPDRGDHEVGAKDRKCGQLLDLTDWPMFLAAEHALTVADGRVMGCVAHGAAAPAGALGQKLGGLRLHAGTNAR